MSASAARRVGGVDERRRQATLLHPFVNGVRAGARLRAVVVERPSGRGRRGTAAKRAASAGTR